LPIVAFYFEAELEKAQKYSVMLEGLCTCFDSNDKRSDEYLNLSIVTNVYQPLEILVSVYQRLLAASSNYI